MKFSDTLHLVLKDKWFQMYKDGLKTEEYRAITSYWCNRLLGVVPMGQKYWQEKLNLVETFSRLELRFCYYRQYRFVTFHRGYSKETLTFLLDNVLVGYGDKNLGAPDTLCFILKVGKFVSYIDKNYKTKHY